MKHLIAAVLCILLPVSVLANSAGYKVSYDGGSIPGEKAGTHVYLYIEANQVRLVQKETVLATIPAASVTEVSSSFSAMVLPVSGLPSRISPLKDEVRCRSDH